MHRRSPTMLEHAIRQVTPVTERKVVKAKTSETNEKECKIYNRENKNKNNNLRRTQGNTPGNVDYRKITMMSVG